MRRGIRQGCPLSPLLFAIYADQIAIEMNKLNKNKMEPGMLLYADDMTIWADTEEELKTKITKALQVMKSLGLNLSIDKTEVQHNKHQKPSLEGNVIMIDEQKKGYTYQRMDKSIRYLGTWTTANMDKEGGLALLREKMQK